MKLKLPLLLALIASLLMVSAAQAMILRKTVNGAEATVQANGCTVTKRADHSLTVACPAGHWAKLTWTMIGPNAFTYAAVDCEPHACRYQPTVHKVARLHASDYVYSVTERVHHNRIVSMTTTWGGYGP
jgi:hypothetical protein